jgi:quercetin dioxygenase-like cupin family protein
MAHEIDGQVHWHEPVGLSPAGMRRFLRPASAYDRFMAQEELPVLRAASILAPAEIELAPWRRLGGRGAFLPLFGTEGGLGCTLLEVPASGALRAEKHLCEEIVLVLHGRGTTEIWGGDASERALFEWQPGSLFAIPMNALHRIVNATASPALLLCASNAPAVLNQLDDVDAVFANPYPARLDEESGQAFDDIEPDPVQGLALCRTHLVPDALGCDLPLDNRFSPGWRQMHLAMTGPALGCAIGEHRPGRYAKAHLLQPATISVCLRGSGYLYLWPERLGPMPWRDGKAAEVLRVTQGGFTLNAAGPGGGRWYQQMFNTGTTPLRHLIWSVPERPAGPPGEEMRDLATTELPEGGSMIPYWLEDPFLRADYAQALTRSGAINRMRDADYRDPDAA